MDTLTKIFSILQSKGIEQTVFAALLDVKPQVVSDWKSGRNKSYVKYIVKIASVLGVSVDYLLGSETNKENTELAEYLAVLASRPEMQMMFNLTKDATKADVEAAVKIVEAFLESRDK